MPPWPRYLLLLLLSFHVIEALPLFWWPDIEYTSSSSSSSSPSDPFIKNEYAEIDGRHYPLLRKSEHNTEVVVDGRPHSLFTGSCSNVSFCDSDYSNINAGTCHNASIYADSSKELIRINHLCRCEYPFGGPACNHFAQCPDYCRERISNGVCDVDCLLRECAYDGDDCRGKEGAPHLVPSDSLGPLWTRFSFSPVYFYHFSIVLFQEFSSYFNGTAEFSMAVDGEGYMALDNDGGSQTRLNFRHYADLPFNGGLELELIIDISRCTRDCFTSVDDVIERLNRMIEEKVFAPGTPLSMLLSAYRPDPPPPSLINWLAIVAFVVTLSFAVVGALIHKQREPRKRNIEAPTWKIPRLGEETVAVFTKKDMEMRTVEREEINEQKKTKTTSLHFLAADKDRPFRITESDDVRAVDDFGRTALHYAVTHRTSEVTEKLLRAGADPSAADNEGLTPLHSAMIGGRSPSFFRALVQWGGDVAIFDKEGRSLIFHAVQTKSLDILQTLLQYDEAKKMINYPSTANVTPLALSVSMADDDISVSITEALLEAGADIEFKGDISWTNPDIPLLPPLFHAVNAGHAAQVSLLLSKGAHLNAIDDRGRTALHHAASKGNCPMAKLLVDHGIRVLIVDDEENTAQRLAESLKKSDYRMDSILSLFSSSRANVQPNKPKRTRIRRKAPVQMNDTGYCSGEERVTPPAFAPPPLPPPLPPLNSIPFHSSSFPIPTQFWNPVAPSSLPAPSRVETRTSATIHKHHPYSRPHPK